MKSPGFRKALRLAEAELLIPLLPKQGRILELGAGAGWQARFLAERGFDVTAIDVTTSIYRHRRTWPVLEYDGTTLPFQSGRFSAVFSSNALEHIRDLSRTLSETDRVLTDDGLEIHLVPTATWRFWTLLTHYPYLPYYIKSGLRARRQNGTESDPVVGTLRALLRACAPARHGERGTALSELYRFSRRSWLRLLDRPPRKLVQFDVNHLFYTGHGLLAERMSLSLRRKFSRILGSSCHLLLFERSDNSTRLTDTDQQGPPSSNVS